MPVSDSAIPSVCHLVISLAPGGLERLVVEWTHARNRAHPGSTFICCLDEPGLLAAEVTDGIVHTLAARRDRWPWDTRAVRRLREHTRGVRLVHSHNLAAQQYAALACFGTGIRHLHTAHGSDVHAQGIKQRLRQRLLGAMTNQLVAVSAATAGQMAPLWGVSPDRLRVIPNGVSPAADVPAESFARLRQALGISPGARVLGAVGRLARVKGFDRLIAVLPAVARALPAVTLVLVGDGPERAALEAQAVALGVRERVLFTGYRPDARALYGLFDLYVAPSRSEGLPVALLEAMSAGCPVLVTDVGDQRAVIDNGAAGALLPADTEDWAAELVKQLGADGGASAAERAAVARARVASHFSMEATLAAYERSYRNLAGLDLGA